MSTQVHPALASAPKSTREALQRIVDYSKTHKLANGKYVNRGSCCAIGLFFTPEQLEQIHKSKMNDQRVKDLAKKFGKENIESMTGLTVEQADAIQWINDGYDQSFLIPKLEEILRTGSGCVQQTNFKLKS